MPVPHWAFSSPPVDRRASIVLLSSFLSHLPLSLFPSFSLFPPRPPRIPWNTAEPGGASPRRRRADRPADNNGDDNDARCGRPGANRPGSSRPGPVRPCAASSSGSVPLALPPSRSHTICVTAATAAIVIIIVVAAGCCRPCPGRPPAVPTVPPHQAPHIADSTQANNGTALTQTRPDQTRLDQTRPDLDLHPASTLTLAVLVVATSVNTPPHTIRFLGRPSLYLVPLFHPSFSFFLFSLPCFSPTHLSPLPSLILRSCSGPCFFFLFFSPSFCSLSPPLFSLASLFPPPTTTSSRRR